MASEEDNKSNIHGLVIHISNYHYQYTLFWDDGDRLDGSTTAEDDFAEFKTGDASDAF